MKIPSDGDQLSSNKVLKSTCNIILTTDVCPNSENNNDECITHTYTFSPDQTQILQEMSKRNLKDKKISKDVSCQTSDCEISPLKSRSKSVENRRRYYSDHRRATDSLAMTSSRDTNDDHIVNFIFNLNFF